MDKDSIKYIFGLIFLALLSITLIPYFTADLGQIEQEDVEKNNDEIALREKQNARNVELKTEEKIYLMGKFDPAQREDFALIPIQYTFGGNKMYIRKEALDAFLKMQRAANLDDINLKIVSAARNFNYQKDLWNDKWTGAKLVDGENLFKKIPDELERFNKILEYSAVPGTSRHHWGTEIDINGVNPSYFDTDEGEKEYEWLEENAPMFGFCQTYTKKGEERDTGYNEEKWHWSYLPLSKKFTQEYKNLITDDEIEDFDGDEYVQNFDLINDYVLSINPECM